ncbi:MAG: hypothetical protein OXB92_11835 [Acidimicrobiaceae bacterium]|nr:cytotoxic translational repressor of toxin-antitoxin stability system [Acidimicrobiia bacterium]MCY4494536.1 hypothetical protein [Acidimicrobiaceae bacterium]
MSHPAPTRTAHEKFCTTEGWQIVGSAIGKNNTHHNTYELTLPSGNVLRTRVSRPVNKRTYGPRMWAHILRDQLDVTEPEFWDCADRGIIPNRSSVPANPPRSAPTQVLHQLKHRVGLSDSQIAALTREQAIERLNEYWAAGH